MSQEMTSLFRLAIASGRVETVRSHLERGADANARDHAGSPALLIAASRGRQDICEVLLEHGADPAASDASGRTLSEYALQWGFIDLVEQSRADDPEPETEVVVETATVASPSSDGDTSGGMFGWEPEAQSDAPPEDALRAVAAHAAHEAFSRPSANVDSADWSSIALDLPRSLSGNCRVPHRIEALVLRGIRAGWVSTDWVREALPTSKLRQEFARPLTFALSDIGIPIRGAVWDSMLLPDADQGAATQNEADLLLQVVEHLDAIADEDIEARYLRETKVLREGASDIQAILWSRAEELRRRAAAAFSVMPDAVRLLEEAGAVPDRPRTDEADAEDVEDVDDVEEADDLQSADAVEPVQDDHADNVFYASLSKLSPTELTDRLADLRPSLAVMRRAVQLASRDRGTGLDELRYILDELGTKLDTIVETNLSLVTWFANRYRSSGTDYLDIVQDGNIGLMHAVQRFDPSRGAKLATYAIWWIRQSITRSLADTGRTIRVPVHVQEKSRKLQRLSQSLRAETGLEPSAAELARGMEMSERSVAVLEARTAQFVPANGDNVEHLSRTAAERIVDTGPAPDAMAWAWEVRKELDERLAILEARQARILRLRFGMAGDDEHTLEEVGELYGVTRERIRQIESKALKIIGHPNRSKDLKVFLDD